MFGWQSSDSQALRRNSGHRIQFIYHNDFDSQYCSVNELFENMYANGITVFNIMAGNAYLESPYSPLRRALHEENYHKSDNTAIAKSVIKEVVQSSIATEIVSKLLLPQKPNSIILTDTASELVAGFQKLSGSSKLAFVFKGYPQFDSSSQELIYHMISQKLDDAFPFLCKANYIFLCEEAEPESSYELLKRFPHIDLHLKKPTIKDAAEIFNTLYPGHSLNPETVELIFGICGGRLSLLEIVASYAKTHGYSAENPKYYANVIDAVLENRTQVLSLRLPGIDRALQVAAAIGRSFPVELLRQSIDTTILFDSLISLCSTEYLMKVNGATGAFTYTEIWSYFYSGIGEKERKAIFLALADSLYLLNPGDYMTRAQYLEQAKEHTQACEIYILAYYSLQSQGITGLTQLSQKVEALIEGAGLISFWHTLLAYYSHLDNYQYAQALLVLEEDTSYLNLRMVLLKEYLEAYAIHKAGLSMEDEQRALVSLKNAVQNAKGYEDGLWCDCQNMLISLYMNVYGDVENATLAMKELAYYYSQNQSAHYCQVGLYTLYRKWAALYSVERAVVKTKQSVDFFRQTRHIRQFLMALNNHSANLIALGRFQEAQCFLKEAMVYIKQNPISLTICLYVLNNYYICQCLLAPTNAAEYLLDIEKLLEPFEKSSVGIIPLINCAVFSALAMDYTKAKKLLQQAIEKNTWLQDDYYTYFINANLAAIFYLEGETEMALSTLEKCQQPPSLMKATECALHQQRTRHWQQVMQTQTIQDPIEFFSYLDDHVHSEQWPFVSKGFLFSDIQFWTEA